MRTRETSILTTSSTVTPAVETEELSTIPNKKKKLRLEAPSTISSRLETSNLKHPEETAIASTDTKMPKNARESSMEC